MNRTLCYQIGGHKLALNYVDGQDAESLLPSFVPFLIPTTTDVALIVTIDDSFCMQRSADEVGQFDCGGSTFGVYQTPDGGYQFDIRDLHAQLCATMQASPDFSRCTVALHASTLGQRSYGLNNAMMLAYAFCFVTSQTLLVHASVICKDGVGYLMIAPSGTGKSTHTRMWYDHIPGCDLMNDDNPIVRITNGRPTVYGSPWSGKTPCYRNVQAPVGAFVRIQQRPSNHIERLQPLKAYTQLLPAMSSMKWDHRVYTAVNDTVIALIGQVAVYELGCLPNGDAARLCHATVAVAPAPESPIPNP